MPILSEIQKQKLKELLSNSEILLDTVKERFVKRGELLESLKTVTDEKEIKVINSSLDVLHLELIMLMDKIKVNIYQKEGVLTGKVVNPEDVI
jgi:hypothetical protein